MCCRKWPKCVARTQLLLLFAGSWLTSRAVWNVILMMTVSQSVTPIGRIMSFPTQASWHRSVCIHCAASAINVRTFTCSALNRVLKRNTHRRRGREGSSTYYILTIIIICPLEGEGWSAICYMRNIRGCFCWCYITLCICIPYLGRPFIKTLHSLDGLMIIDSLLNFFLVVFSLCFARFRLQLYSCYFIIFASYTVISQLFVQR